MIPGTLDKVQTIIKKKKGAGLEQTETTNPLDCWERAYLEGTWAGLGASLGSCGSLAPGTGKFYFPSQRKCRKAADLAKMTGIQEQLVRSPKMQVNSSPQL